MQTNSTGITYYESNIYYKMEPFLYSPWFSYGLKYSTGDQLAQIRYIATQSEWQVLRKVKPEMAAPEVTDRLVAAIDIAVTRQHQRHGLSVRGR